MEYRTLELNIASAKDLKDVNLISKMQVYAVVSISGDTLNRKKFKTTVDKEGGKNPSWNFPIKLTVNDSLALQDRLVLEIKLRCERVLTGDKEIGNLHVPLKELLDETSDGKSFKHVSYQVRKPSGKPKGSLNFSFKFGDKFSAPVTAPPPKVAPKAGGSAFAPYPPPPQQYATGNSYPPSGYPQPQPGYGYPPPQPGYGYPAQGQGYGYPVQGQRPAKNNLGMGLGMGLLGGALGGLLIGEMMSDAGAYDAGFGDAGGFDVGF